MPRTGIRAAFSIAALALMVFANSCASATKRYEQGQELEQQGRDADAARRYLDAVKKDPALAEARQRLLETGARAIADFARQADALEVTGSHTDAADVLRTGDALIRDAAGAGVALQAPADYAQKHVSIFGRAVDQAIEEAATSTQRGDYARSVELVERAQERWEPRIDQQSALNRVLRETHVAWARSDIAASRFRSAYAHGEAAGAIPGVDRVQVSALQREALRRGTALVAVFPAGARSGTDSRMLPELNDLLALEHWQRPPLWIEVVNTIESQRLVQLRGPAAVRLRDLAGRDLDTQDVSSLAMQVGARFAVTFALDSVRYSESKVERRRRTAKTRAGVDTAFTVEEGELETWARVNWRAIDVGSGRGVVERGDASSRASSSFRRATYGGNWRDVNLAPADRALFEQRDARDNQDTLRQLSRRLAGRLGPDVFSALVRRVE